MWNLNASCELCFHFFARCNRCLCSAARSQANSGVLIIALATGTGLVAVESEPVSYWLPWRSTQSTEFHLMKGSVQQAAARGCSLRVGRGFQQPLQLVNQFEHPPPPLYNAQDIHNHSFSFRCQNTTCVDFKR